MFLLEAFEMCLIFFVLIYIVYMIYNTWCTGGKEVKDRKESLRQKLRDVQEEIDNVELEKAVQKEEEKLNKKKNEL